MVKIIAVSFFMVSFVLNLSAQDPWSLEDCINYAMENNIQIKQYTLNTQYNENLLKQSKFSQIPNLNASSNYSYSWGRALDQTTYTFTDNQQIHSLSLGISSSVNLFNGFQIRNTIRQNQLNLMSSYEDVEKIKNDISLNLAAAYLQILFNRELVAVTENQLTITGQQVERTRKMVEAGKLAKGSLLEIQAQYAAEELNLITAQNQLYLSYLNIQQILNLPYDPGFDVIIPDLPVPADNLVMISVENVYEIAQQEMPEIRSAALAVESSEKGLDIAKGRRSPQLRLSANYNTGFSDVREKVLYFDENVQSPIGVTQTGDAVYSYPMRVPQYGKYPFFEQLNDNLSAGIGVGLSIPIFNGWQVNTGIANARISLENTRLELENQRNILYATIQKAYADALAALNKFNASRKALISMEESFLYTEKKFEVGLVNAVDYNTSKNQLAATQSDLLQAKYDFIFKTKILNFYKGEHIIL
ncbi:MAG TPA: TolC family protein [Bacteroidaceae bacterium]|nr:TolC family protein [Bacteroidaceae bacterium]